MKKLVQSVLFVVLACGFAACEKPMPPKKESKVERQTLKRRMLSQKVEQPTTQLQESQE